MIDTPFESWCALVAHLLNEKERLPDENALDYISRVTQKYYCTTARAPYEAFMNGSTAEHFAGLLLRYVRIDGDN